MRVKIGDTYYDSVDVPILLELEEFDRVNILKMLGEDHEAKHYVAYTGAHFENHEQLQAWIRGDFKIMRG